MNAPEDTVFASLANILRGEQLVYVAFLGLGYSLGNILYMYQVVGCAPYLKPKNLDFPIFLALQYLVYLAFILMLNIMSHATFDGLYCHVDFPVIVPLIKITFDLIPNTLMGLYLIYSVRGLAIKKSTTFWNYLIIEGFLYTLSVFIVNLITDVLITTKAFGAFYNDIYSVDWALKSSLVTLLLLSAQKRREHRRQALIMDDESESDVATTRVTNLLQTLEAPLHATISLGDPLGESR
ncbi:hypothetical protein BJ684DRAFT_20288 [Piptocephalis cylindrospora]|uniref:Uncharacterized protein n=1 Tax=Piptocephalis cylindrospora TaxID=1907219 RepID=A0A4P9Y3D6_9FUNG|nr:hypothetical protein BJ684DRAFT_20288 [Piptocephalis cylindrospora]|eukprot:RKP13204.1 hypothetical protein BJ684DRAFT_20288 [Piptocephalis cylindrospora]